MSSKKIYSEKMTYTDFLETKKKKINESGFDVDDSKLNDKLFDFQRHIVKKALKVGKYAIFADCGLGKTFMQLEFAKDLLCNVPIWIGLTIHHMCLIQEQML
jgi:hypothetical protein